MRGLLAVAVGRRGGETRSRRLSPERRREIASWARWIRSEKERGERTSAEKLKLVIGKLRAMDADLALVYKHIEKMPLKYQEAQIDALPIEDKEKIRQAWEAACPAQ